MHSRLESSPFLYVDSSYRSRSCFLYDLSAVTTTRRRKNANHHTMNIAQCNCVTWEMSMSNFTPPSPSPSTCFRFYVGYYFYLCFYFCPFFCTFFYDSYLYSHVYSDGHSFSFSDFHFWNVSVPVYVLCFKFLVLGFTVYVHVNCVHA